MEETIATRFRLLSSRRCSDSTPMDATDNISCDRIPPLHDIPPPINETSDTDPFADCENAPVVLPGDSDEIEDDWFAKLVNSNEAWSNPVPAEDGSFSDYCFTSTIPLLPDDLDFKNKTLRTLRVGIKKIWKRGSATITEADRTYKVAYLGNVLTGMAKGEGCIEKPLNTLWKNYSSSSKPDVQMKITATQSGLKAVTKDHGLTEYWSHRITYCSAPSSLPRVFCWIYRHEGRKLKQELRCHAVLCSKESVARRIASTLRLRLAQALIEFKRDKLLRQNARLSLANCVYDNPSLPRRKILLSTGSQNYKPPLERSKSAPKLMAIEESLEEEECTPKVKRKCSQDQQMEVIDESEECESENPVVVNSENLRNNDDKQDEQVKVTNLNFIKKICSSIENIVESTSNYGKKLLTERRSSKDIVLTTKKTEESILKKTTVEEEGLAYAKQNRPRKSVTFEDLSNSETEPEPETETETETCEFTKCTDYKKTEENVMIPSEEITTINETPLAELEIKDPESSDEGSNSLQSISSCSSEFSSLLTSSSDKSNESLLNYKMDVKLDSRNHYFNNPPLCKTSMERLTTYLSCYDDIFLTDCQQKPEKVALHPTGDGIYKTEAHPEKMLLGHSTFSVTNIETEEVDSLSEDDATATEDDVVSDESGYVELAENTVKRLSLDSKEKDVPYHQIIKSSILRPRQIESSCLHV